jgi:hypothetical protein
LAIASARGSVDKRAMSGRTVSLLIGGIFIFIGLMNIAQSIVFKVRRRGFFWARSLYLDAEDDGHDPVGFQTVVWGNAAMGGFAIFGGLYVILTALNR